MSVEKLNIEHKQDSPAKQKLIASGDISTKETLTAAEINELTAKTNELVDAYNFGAPITAFNFKENVPTYADLPTENNEINDGYGVIADGLVYVWNGEAFQPEGEGMDLGLKPSGIVEEDNALAVSGAKVFEKYNPFFKFSNLLPFTLAKGELSQVTGNANSSENWLRTGIISCKPLTTYSISGLGIGISTLSAKRIMLYADGALLDIITQNTLESEITFTTPEGCDFFRVQVEGGSNVGADIPNSPFWENLKIAQGTEIIEDSIYAERIVGVIKTEQITEIEETVDFVNSVTKENYEYVGIFTTNGAISGYGANNDLNYRRTSVTSIGSMALVDETKNYTYTGEIETSGYSGVIYKNENLNNIGRECIQLQQYNRHPLTLPAGTKYIAACSYLTEPVIEEKSKHIESDTVNKSNVFYIDANYVGDESDGTVTKPFTSISDAIDNASGTAIFKISEGDYRETLALSSLNSGNYSFVVPRGEKVRILGSNKLIDFTLTPGFANTYEALYGAAIPSGSRFGRIVFEDGNQSRPITQDERHPLQKSLSHRLPFTPLIEKTSITEVEDNAGSFYQDLTNGKIYIHTSNSDHPQNNGFSYEIAARGWMVPPSAKIDKSIDISLENLQFYYGVGSLWFRGFQNVYRKDITAIGTLAAGAFRDDTSNVISYNDEAAFCNGDGINGHFSAWGNYQSLTDNRSMSPTNIYYDPWCHDNFDDGMSHHENHRVIVHGGLIEHNDDGGIRASNDSGYTVYNCYSRKNGLVTNAGEGFSVVNPTINENRNGCKMVLFNCFSEGNAIGYASISDSRNQLEMINCISRDNTRSELRCSAGKIISRNTLATNSAPEKLKEISGNGVIDVLNDELLM